MKIALSKNTETTTDSTTEVPQVTSAILEAVQETTSSFKNVTWIEPPEYTKNVFIEGGSKQFSIKTTGVIYEEDIELGEAEEEEGAEAPVETKVTKIPKSCLISVKVTYLESDISSAQLKLKVEVTQWLTKEVNYKASYVGVIQLDPSNGWKVDSLFLAFDPSSDGILNKKIQNKLEQPKHSIRTFYRDKNGKKMFSSKKVKGHSTMRIIRRSIVSRFTAASKHQIEQGDNKCQQQ